MTPPVRDMKSCPADAPTHIVGIGASAGGLDALRILLQRFTADCTSFIVVMHLLPTRASSLAALLAPMTKMSVTTAIDGESLRKNCIYVIPPGVLLTLSTDRTLRLTPLPKTFPRTTVDQLFHSVSVLGAAGVGIVLSGKGRDGAEGLEEIRSRGGATFVQDPRTASSPEMPENGREFADQCLAPGALGDALMRLVGAAPKDPADLRPAIRYAKA